MYEICPKKASEELCRLMGNISKNVKNMRKEFGATQNDVAYNIGSDKSVISSIERGSTSNISLYTLVKISSVFDTKVEMLICDLSDNQ